MKRLKFLIFIIFIMLCLGANYTYAYVYGNVYGRIVDEETKKGIPGVPVRINIEESGTYTDTNQNGEFSFKNLPCELEFQIYYNVGEKTYPGMRYFRQRDYIYFTIPKGKNLHLKDIEIKKGVQLKGVVKLWNGTVMPGSSIYFELVQPAPFEPNQPGWSGGLSRTDGHYESQLLPINVDLLLKVSYLIDPVTKISYGSVKKTIRVNDGNSPQNMDIIIPNIPTEVKGRIVDRNGQPQKNLEIDISFVENRIKSVTNENGIFICKHIQPGNYAMLIPWKEGNLFKDSSITSRYDLHLGESLWFDIIIGDKEYIDYKITRANYKQE